MTPKHVAIPEPDAGSAAAPDIRILAGDPSPEEVAAVTAVLALSLEQLGAEHRRRDTGTTAWQRSQRSMRGPLRRGGWTDFRS